MEEKKNTPISRFEFLTVDDKNVMKFKGVYG
jgi:hypothetical protein